MIHSFFTSLRLYPTSVTCLLFRVLQPDQVQMLPGVVHVTLVSVLGFHERVAVSVSGRGRLAAGLYPPYSLPLPCSYCRPQCRFSVVCFCAVLLQPSVHPCLLVMASWYGPCCGCSWICLLYLFATCCCCCWSIVVYSHNLRGRKKLNLCITTGSWTKLM